jgi:hypothetical protein
LGQHYREQMTQVFGNTAFSSALFYQDIRGLRFELSQGGGAIEQFLLAMQKGQAICAEIFAQSSHILVCVTASTDTITSPYPLRKELRELKKLGITLPTHTTIWRALTEYDAEFEFTMALYDKFNHFLLDYDRADMEAVFGANASKSHSLV